MHWRCVHAVLTLYWRYIDAILRLYWRHIGAVLMLYWRRINAVSTTYWRRIDALLTLNWRSIDAVLMLYWRCVDTLLTPYWICLSRTCSRKSKYTTDVEFLLIVCWFTCRIFICFLISYTPPFVNYSATSGWQTVLWTSYIIHKSGVHLAYSHNFLRHVITCNNYMFAYSGPHSDGDVTATALTHIPTQTYS